MISVDNFVDKINYVDIILLKLWRRWDAPI